MKNLIDTIKIIIQINNKKEFPLLKLTRLYHSSKINHFLIKNFTFSSVVRK